MRVLKFGGTSLANAERLQAAARIVVGHRAQGSVAVVVSAMAGITDALLKVAHHAETTHSVDFATLERIAQRHRTAYQAVLGEVPAAFEQQWQALRHDASELLQPSVDGSLHAEVFSGWGERLMAPLFALALNEIGITANAFQDAPVVLESGAEAASSPTASLLATRAWLVPQLATWLTQRVTLVLPGYVARDAAGQPATLGRNGSDYSAAMIAAVLGAEALYIYSDVAGVYSADPHLDATAVLLSSLTYAEAAAIAAQGAKVLHPRTIGPLAQAAIPLLLRSTLAPDQPGTIIAGEAMLALAKHHALPFAAIWSL